MVELRTNQIKGNAYITNMLTLAVHLAKVDVESSILFARSRLARATYRLFHPSIFRARFAQYLRSIALFLCLFSPLPSHAMPSGVEAVVGFVVAAMQDPQDDDDD